MSQTAHPSPDGVDLTTEERKAIDSLYEHRLTVTHYQVLGIPSDADRKRVRDAYFALSKRFHPDVFYRRDLGAYKQRLDEVFRMFTRAYEVLGNPKQRVGYDLHLASYESPSRPPPAPLPEIESIVAAAQAERANASMVPPPDAHSALPPAGDAAHAIPASALRAPTPARVAIPSPPLASPAEAISPIPAPLPTAPAQGAATVPPPPPEARTGVPTVSEMPPPGMVGRVSASAMASAVMPPPLRTAPPNPSQARSIPAPPAPTAPVDPALRQRAMQAMARKLSSVTHPAARPAAPAAPLAQGGPVDRVGMVDRATRVAQLVAAADAAQKEGKFDVAMESYRQALTIAPDDAGIKLKCDAVTRLAHEKKAQEHIEAAREAMRSGKAAAAAEAWEKAHQLRPGDTSLLLNAAEVLAKHSDQPKRAADLAQRVIVADSGNVRAHVVLATVFTRAGLKASARSALANLERLDPGNAAIKELKEKLGPLTIAEQLGIRGR